MIVVMHICFYSNLLQSLIFLRVMYIFCSLWRDWRQLNQETTDYYRTPVQPVHQVPTLIIDPLVRGKLLIIASFTFRQTIRVSVSPCIFLRVRDLSLFFLQLIITTLQRYLGITSTRPVPRPPLSTTTVVPRQINRQTLVDPVVQKTCHLNILR